MTTSSSSTLTPHLKFSFILIWILTGGLQYGIGIAALNSAQEAIMCRSLVGHKALFGLKSCIDISDFEFGVLTTAFTIGGFVSSLRAGSLADKMGRRKTAVWSAALIVLGSLAIAFGEGFSILVLGRFAIGLACGIYTVLVPLFVSEVSPPAIKGNVGILTQLSICVGIFTAQAVSVPFATPGTGKWRYGAIVSGAIALGQALFSPMMIESPIWLADQNRKAGLASPNRSPRRDGEESGGVFSGGEDEESNAQQPLLSPSAQDEDERSASPTAAQSKSEGEDSLSLTELFKSKDGAVKHAWRTIVLSQLIQQFSGVNAVMYYSTSILAAVDPKNAKYISVFVAFINVLFTFPPIWLVTTLGRRSLMVISLISMSISSLILAFSINGGYFLLASVFIVLYVAAFSIGTGPIPFLILGEIPPLHARSATASLGLGVNWSSNAAIGLLFLPLRDLMPGKGSIFYLFAIISGVGSLVMGKML